MTKGYLAALAFFVLGFICVLFLTGGKQFALAMVSFFTSLCIACAVTSICFGKKV